MDKAKLDGLTSELNDYIKRFEACFKSTPSREHLTAYVRGQLGPLQRKSVEPIAIEAGIEPRTLQQFIGSHKWDEAAMRSRVRSIVATERADAHAVGVIDETSFNKKGKKTVGVQRQWCGHTGKIDNCVQTVHLTYVARDFATIIDSDLYLPKDWADDKARRDEGCIPDSVKFRKKWEIALEMLARAKREGVVIRWLTADEFYGRASEFRGPDRVRVKKARFHCWKTGYRRWAFKKASRRSLRRRLKKYWPYGMMCSKAYGETWWKSSGRKSNPCDTSSW